MLFGETFPLNENSCGTEHLKHVQIMGTSSLNQRYSVGVYLELHQYYISPIGRFMYHTLHSN